MKKILAAVAALVVVAAGGYYYAETRAEQEMQAGVAAFRAALPPGATFTYEGATPDLFHRSAQLTNVQITNGPATLKATEAEVAPDGENRLRRLTLRTVSLASPGGTASIGLLVADNVAVPLGNTGLDYSTISADHADLQSLQVTTAAKVVATAGHVALDNYGAGRLGSLLVETAGLNVPDETVERVTMDRLAIGGVDFAHFPVSPILSPGAAFTILAVPRPGKSISIDGLAAIAHGKPLVTMARFDSAARQTEPDRAASHSDMRDLVIQTDDELTKGWRALGYDSVRFTIQLDGSAAEMARQVSIDRLDVDAPGIGQFHLAVAMDNVSPALTRPQPGASVLGQALAGLASLQLRSLAISYDDQSLAPKLIAANARTQQVSPAGLVQSVQAKVRAGAAQIGLPDVFVAPVLAFLADPHHLAISMNPPQPVPLMGLSPLIRSAPEQSLGLRVTN